MIEKIIRIIPIVSNPIILLYQVIIAYISFFLTIFKKSKLRLSS